VRNKPTAPASTLQARKHVPVQERQRGPRTPIRIRAHALTAPPLTCWLHSPAPAPARPLAAPEQPQPPAAPAQPPQRQRSRPGRGVRRARALRDGHALLLLLGRQLDVRRQTQRAQQAHALPRDVKLPPLEAVPRAARERGVLSAHPPGRQGRHGSRLKACQRLALTTEGSGRRQACELLSGAASRLLLAQARRCGYTTVLLAAQPAHLNSNAWWLLCQPSPNASTATHQLLRLRTHAHASHKYAGKHAGAQNNSHAEWRREHIGLGRRQPSQHVRLSQGLHAGSRARLWSPVLYDW